MLIAMTSFWIGGMAALGPGMWFDWRRGEGSGAASIIATLLWPAVVTQELMRRHRP